MPNGDAVHRVWCVAEGGGFTVVEIENESGLPFAVAFTRGDLLTSRPPATVPIEGIELPHGSIVVPVGQFVIHRDDATSIAPGNGLIHPVVAAQHLLAVEAG